MTAIEQPCYTLINLPSDSDPPNEMQLKVDLEKGDVKTKIEALKKTIQLIASGERLPDLLMTIIRFVLPLQDHMIKKLLLIFWEIVPKTTQDGKLLQEMILVCDSYRKDLQHPNEFLRGSTLRFLCKLKEPELLEPLMPAIRVCLEHKHSYVRRNAVLAIFTIYRNFEFLIPDAPELIASFLEGEQDMSCKRNAFLMLLHADQERALAYLASCLDQVTSFGDILQLVIVELIYKVSAPRRHLVCHANPSERSRFIRCIYNLLNSTSPAVRYEAAGTLVTLSSAPTAIKAAASCYIELIVKESDNNVKLIVLDRLIALKEHPAHERVLQDLVMDVLRVLASPDLEVRKKTLNLAMELVSSRNIEEMVLVLRKEVAKTHNVGEHEDTGRYRQLLVRTLHSCCIKFPDVAATVIPVLIEFLSDTNELAAADVLVFVREAIQKFEALRPLIIERLLDAFPTIKSVKVHRAALWILGEYACSPDDIQAVMNQIRQTLGEIPLVDDELRKAAGERADDDATLTQTPVQKLVTSDGTYATQSAFNATSSSKKGEARPPLRQYLMDGDFFIGSSLGTSLAKLALRYCTLVADPRKHNRFTAEAMLIISSVLHLGKSGLPAKAMTNDDADRLLLCLKVLSDKSPVITEIFSEKCRQALSIMLAAKAEEEATTQKAKEKPGSLVHADDPISFLQLSSLRGELGATENVFELSLSQAVVGGGRQLGPDPGLPGKLSKVTQLTGFSDPVYAEAYVHVNQYDIVLDVLIVNQTGDTLQNCTLELATLGDLKLVEKPQPVVLAPRDFCNIKANVKVASTENGIIFGNIVYDVSGAASDRNVVVLNDIHIDIMDYIVPASCNDSEFRQMWAEFEWENKVSVNTNISDLHEYLRHLISSTNMKCLTPEKVMRTALSGQCGFMAANMYARSIFGEDALANLSIEKPFNKPDAPVTGHIRIRAKSQGMALSLGDKINMTQKGPQKTVCGA
ncbi:coatomer subunit beta isoform X1 [Bacillus rossius redtenbacheri]|uniref:coatomer subunit beta isoform X1 n=1 Tax=Bacillus rossius redtenbacheri TaxID=93214 RepID=UPI002FDEEC49